MENATKALLIAAGILLIVMLLSTIAVFWDELAGYFTAKNDAKILEQTIEFNNKFANYNGQTIRGNELISVMSRIIDYNNYQSDMEGYERIVIKIYLEGHQNEFKYENETVTNSIFTGSTISNSTNDNAIKRVAETSSRLVSASGIANLTDTKLQRLSSEIENIVADAEITDLEDKEAYKIQRAQILTKILGTEINKNDNVDNIKKATYQYYQFTQFKRAMFKCTGVTYNETNGRVNGMTFKVVTENGQIKFD